MAGKAVTRGTRRVLPLIVGTLGLVACGGLLLAVTYRHDVRLDLTPQREYTLSPHARKILGDLSRDVRITAFIRSEDPRTPFLKDLLWRVRAATPRVAYELVDLNRSPALARRYAIDRYGALVVESGGRRRDVSNANEGLLMAAVLAVSRDRQRVAYFLTGHGERSPESTDRKTGYSTAKRTLEEDLFQVRELPVIGPDGVPPDASLLVIAGPRKELLPEETSRLASYRERGGDVLLLLDPESPVAMADLLVREGVVVLDEVVVDPERRLASGEGVTVLVSGLLPSFLVSATLEAPPVFSYARAMRVAPAAGDAVIPFLQTSPTGYSVPMGGSPGAVPAKPRGPAVVGAAVRGAAAGETRRAGRVIVLGDSDFATNGMIEYLGNKDLLVNSANWLARDDSLIAARAQQKEVGREQFFVTEAQGAMAFWLAAVAQPALFLVAGLVVFLRRRAR